MIDSQAEEIATALEAARANTLRLFDLVAREEDLRQSPGFGFRPVLWHLAHIGVFEGYWILQRVRGDQPLDALYERIFDPIATPREESKNLPARREMENYLSRVRGEVLRHLERARFDDTHPLLRRDAYAFRLILEHEQQHQETLAYLLHLLDPAKKKRPAEGMARNQVGIEPPSQVGASSPPPHDMVEIPAGEFVMGADEDAFAYDNERPAHAVLVPAFKLDRLLVSNENYARFVAEGGYERREWWGDEGWAWREREHWSHPLYWRRDGDEWLERTMFNERPLARHHPVTGVSWYEAEAYARFAGKRLPTEAEWERAASASPGGAGLRHKRRYAWGDEPPSEVRCNFDLRFWGTTPVDSFPAGTSADGCLDLTGNLWEWTSDKFSGYPGFEPFPYPEYSAEWFDEDHRVLKGGSWATTASVLRTSFRNFFRRHFRIAFAGIRCAADG